MYNIEISQINNATLQDEARKRGITHARLVGFGYIDGNDSSPEHLVKFYAMPFDGAEILVAQTNSDLVWDEEDGFEKLAESCGVI